MLRFKDGIAKGKHLSCARAPIFLRVVVAKDGTVDALDQSGDSPKKNEKIVVYRRDGDVGVAFVDGVRNGKRCGWTEQTATYELYPVQPADEILRDTAAWQAWATAEHARTTEAK